MKTQNNTQYCNFSIVINEKLTNFKLPVIWEYRRRSQVFFLYSQFVMGNLKFRWPTSYHFSKKIFLHFYSNLHIFMYRKIILYCNNTYYNKLSSTWKLTFFISQYKLSSSYLILWINDQKSSVKIKNHCIKQMFTIMLYFYIVKFKNCIRQ